jgi:uncharacterized protein
MKPKFVGRQNELNLLRDLKGKATSSLVVVYGRRRIGKSRLIEEFAKGANFYVFTGLHPEIDTTAQDQRTHFHEQYLDQCSDKPEKFRNWTAAFAALAKQMSQGRVVILLDEISWMATEDRTFLGKLKSAWDTKFKQNPQLMLVLCGSVSSWIEKRLITNRGFFGRISLKVRLKELSLPECNAFWAGQGTSISVYEKLKILSVTGGVPKYLEEINPALSADHNIHKLCFSPNGFLCTDYDDLFSSMLERDSTLYQSIVEALSHKKLQHAPLMEALQKQGGGIFSQYMNELKLAGFVSIDHTWNLRNGELARFSQYRLSDNYVRFYLKYMRAKFDKIETGGFEMHSLNALPNWMGVMALQVENLILNNRHALHKWMGIFPDEVVCSGPFFQRKTARQKGCQIDYLVQTRAGVLYVCEIKFTRNIIRPSIIEDMKQKISRIARPKNTTAVPVLIHFGEVHDDVVGCQYFGKIINMAWLFGDNPELKIS